MSVSVRGTLGARDMPLSHELKSFSSLQSMHPQPATELSHKVSSTDYAVHYISTQSLAGSEQRRREWKIA